MTPKEWQEHAARCREVAATLDDAVARRVLLEAQVVGHGGRI